MVHFYQRSRDVPSGLTHYVEYKNLVTDARWRLLTTIAGDGSVANITDSGANTATRFYRIPTR